jgi:NAD-dependent DNA ligase
MDTFGKAGAASGAMTQDRRKDRSIDELIGLSRGFLADGCIVQSEAEYLLQWLEANKEFGEHFPFNVLYPRIYEMLSDDVLDSDEEGELMQMLLALQGGTLQKNEVQAASNASVLPVCEPAPEIIFEGKKFVVTGNFATGNRKEVTRRIEALGGIVKKDVIKAIDYLVIGEVGSRDWMHSSFGRKIEKAVNYRETGLPISIITEEYWYSHLS